MTSYSDYIHKKEIDAVFSMWFISSIVFFVWGVVLIAAVVTLYGKVHDLEATHKPAVCEACGK